MHFLSDGGIGDKWFIGCQMFFRPVLLIGLNIVKARFHIHRFDSASWEKALLTRLWIRICHNLTGKVLQSGWYETRKFDQHTFQVGSTDQKSRRSRSQVLDEFPSRLVAHLWMFHNVIWCAWQLPKIYIVWHSSMWHIILWRHAIWPPGGRGGASQGDQCRSPEGCSRSGS